MVQSSSNQPQYALQQLQQTIHSQDARIKQLEALTAKLEQRLAEQPTPVTVNYSFEQLKIETLEGTLNIGLNPNKDFEEIDDFSVENQQIQTPTDQLKGATNNHYHSVLQQVDQRMNHYFTNSAPDEIKRLEQQYSYPLDEAYRSFIINDVQKQTNNRAHYYLQQYKDQVDTPNDLQTAVYESVKRDVNKAFSLFIQNLPKERRDDG